MKTENKVSCVPRLMIVPVVMQEDPGQGSSLVRQSPAAPDSVAHRVLGNQEDVL